MMSTLTLFVVWETYSREEGAPLTLKLVEVEGKLTDKRWTPTDRSGWKKSLVGGQHLSIRGEDSFTSSLHDKGKLFSLTRAGALAKYHFRRLRRKFYSRESFGYGKDGSPSTRPPRRSFGTSHQSSRGASEESGG